MDKFRVWRTTRALRLPASLLEITKVLLKIAENHMKSIRNLRRT